MVQSETCSDVIGWDVAPPPAGSQTDWRRRGVVCVQVDAVRCSVSAEVLFFWLPVTFRPAPGGLHELAARPVTTLVHAWTHPPDVRPVSHTSGPAAAPPPLTAHPLPSPHTFHASCHPPTSSQPFFTLAPPISHTILEDVQSKRRCALRGYRL